MEGEIRGDRGEDPAQLSTAKPRERKGGEEMHVMNGVGDRGEVGSGAVDAITSGHGATSGDN